MKAYIYCRVSKPSGRKFGGGDESIDIQIDECIKYCREQGWPDKDILIRTQERTSRNGTNISSLENILGEMSSGDVLVIHTIDRLSRHVLKGVQFLEAIQSKGCRIASVNEHITYDNDDIYGRFEFRNIINHAELESDRMGMRIRRSKKRKLDNRTRVSSTRFQCKTRKRDTLVGTHNRAEMNALAQHQVHHRVATRSMVLVQSIKPPDNENDSDMIDVIPINCTAEPIDIDMIPDHIVGNNLLRGVLERYNPKS